MTGVFRHQVFPTHTAGDGGETNVIFIGFGFKAQDFEVFGDVGAEEITVALFLLADVFQAEFQTGNFTRARIAQEPGIGIASVVAVLHNFAPLVDRGSVLRSAAHAGKFGNALFIEAAETTDGGFGAD